MAHEAFKVYRPKQATIATIMQAEGIIEEFQAAGLTLTLRQLFYQFVSRGLLKNTQKNYTKLGSIIASARMGGMLDWDAIEDRVRHPVIWAEHETADAAVEQALRRFRLPRLNGQPIYVELWVEKDALAGVLEPIAAEYHVVLMVNRGYSSVSAMKDAADRIRSRCAAYGSSRGVILYLGDLDPSGEDMVRDIDDRLGLFLNEGRLVDWSRMGADRIETGDDAEQRKPYIELTVEKLALTIEQVRQYNPPPNPAKLSDSRAPAFIERYGRQSWEVDALAPPVLQALIRAGIEEHLRMDLYNERVDDEKAERAHVREALGIG